MRPVSNSTADARFWSWKSPMPFLFAGFAILLGLITVALIILACSYRKSLSREAEEKQPKQLEMKVLDFEPQILVIMAGDHNPTYIAKPASCSYNGEQV